MGKRLYYVVGVAVLLAIASLSTIHSQTIRVSGNPKATEALNTQINAAVINGAMLGYNVGRNGGTPQDVTRLITQVFNGNTNALLEWADQIGKTNHTKIIIVR